MDENKTKFTDSLLRFGRKWMIHIVFCICFTYLFTHMSLTRPLIPVPSYLEYVFAIFVLLFLYTHYFLFIPKFLLQKKYTQYVIIAIVSAFIWGSCEVFFLKTYLTEFFYSEFTPVVQNKLLVQDLINIFVRNMVLLAVYIHFCRYEKAVREGEDIKIASARQLHLLKVKDNQKKDYFIEIPQLLYCKQVRNYTHYFTDNNEYTTLTTLKEVKELIGDDCIQVSRNLLVMRHAIEDKNDSYVTLHNPSDAEKPIILSAN